MATLSQNVTRAIQDFDDIKDAIEDKGVEVPSGTSTSQYAQKIREIEQGITPSGTKSITANGTDIDVTEYAAVDVSVPQPSGTVNITSNGINIDVAQYAAATVAVPEIEGFLSGWGDFQNDENLTIEVENLCDYASAGRTEITSVVFSGNGEGVRAISNYCFLGCTNLESVNMSDCWHKPTIQNSAFSGCSNLTELLLPLSSPDPPYGIEITGSGVFNGCTSLTSLDMTGVRTLGAGALGGSSLATVYFSDNLTTLGTDSLNASTLTDIYYTGTQQQWEAITGLSGAGIPAGCTIHYEYTPS